MTGPGQLGRALHEEHFWTLVVMTSLEERLIGQPEPLDPQVAADRERLEETLAVLDDMLRHHTFEEDVLFPVLLERGAAEMTRVLTRDHAAIEPLAHQLRGVTLSLLAGDDDPTVWERFREAALDLAAQVMVHLQKEELALIRHLGGVLGERLDRELALQFLVEKESGRPAGGPVSPATTHEPAAAHAPAASNA